MKRLLSICAAVAASSLSALSAQPVVAAEYTIDQSHSSVEFKVKHLAISNVKGSFDDFSGTFT